MVTQANEVQLSCGCKRVYNPQPSLGDVIYCSRHPDSRCIVQTVMGSVWAARCLHRGCRYSRTFGMNETEAHAAAGRHVTKNGGHLVEISKGGNLMSVMSTKEQETLFEPPESLAEPRSR